jgi:NAD-dependent SIR2 family protein deacetylase
MGCIIHGNSQAYGCTHCNKLYKAQYALMDHETRRYLELRGELTKLEQELKTVNENLKLILEKLK